MVVAPKAYPYGTYAKLSVSPLFIDVLSSAAIATPIGISFFYRPCPAAAASSDASLSSYGFALVAIYTTASVV